MSFVLRDVGRTEASLRQLELTVLRRLDGLLHGDHQGLVPGMGSEPGEGREYLPGDDVRRMDWNLTARTTVPHVRDAVADRELEAWAVVDGSASLDFGTGACEKRDLALVAVAAVGFLTARAGNRLGAVIARPDGPVRVPARAGREATFALLHKVASMPRVAEDAAGSSTAPLGAALDELVVVPRRRGLVVVVSDFLDPVESWQRPLRMLSSRHDVLGVEVVDPREVELPAVGVLTLVDPETGRNLEVQTASPKLRERYATAAAAQRKAIARGLRGAGADHLQLRTDRDWLVDIVRFVTQRRRFRAGTAPIAAMGGVR